MTDIHCDGSTTLICYVIEGMEPVVEPASDLVPSVTNNEGEYYAVLKALQAAQKQGIKVVSLFSDSQLVVNQLTIRDQGLPIYKARDKRMLSLRNLVWSYTKSYFERVDYTWIPRTKNPAGKILERLTKK